MNRPPPILNKTSLNFFNSLGANLGNKPLTADNGLPPAVVTPSEVQVTNHGERQITFAEPIPFNTTATEIFDKYITSPATYPTPREDIAKGNLFSPPTFIVRQSIDNDTNGGNPALATPILERVIPDMTLLVNEFPTQKNAKTKVEQIKVTFAKEGRKVGSVLGYLEKFPKG